MDAVKRSACKQEEQLWIGFIYYLFDGEILKISQALSEFTHVTHTPFKNQPVGKAREKVNKQAY